MFYGLITLSKSSHEKFSLEFPNPTCYNPKKEKTLVLWFHIVYHVKQIQLLKGISFNVFSFKIKNLKVFKTISFNLILSNKTNEKGHLLNFQNEVKGKLERDDYYYY